MAWNVITSWGSYLVLVIAGFVMPRLIDRHIGQVSLGIWDFCWSIVHYFNIAGIGLGSGINRYVAIHRIRNDVEGLCRTVSTVMVLQFAIGGAIFFGALLVARLLPLFFSHRLGVDLGTAQLLVIFLGASLAIDMCLEAARGILTGCHRWDINNGINAASQLLATAAMFFALHIWGNLVSLAIAYLVAIAVTESWRMVTAFRHCPELRLGIGYVSWAQAKKLFVFGGKSVTAGLPYFLTVQTTSVLVAGALGPAALAVIARPMALVRHMHSFLNRFSMILTPTAGSLHGTGRGDLLRQLVIDNTRYGVAFTLPMVLFLVIYGETILDLWMGPDYARGTLMTILAVGHFLPVAQGSMLRALAGMNAHGRAALASLVVVAIAFAIGVVIVGFTGWSLEAAALWLIALPLTIAGGIVVPWMGCRRLDIRLRDYVRNAFLAPVLCNIGFAATLYAIQALLVERPLPSLVLGALGGAVVLGALYWFHIATEDMRRRVKGRLRLPGRTIVKSEGGG